jgi:hypothetical protein
MNLWLFCIAVSITLMVDRIWWISAHNKIQCIDRMGNCDTVLSVFLILNRKTWTNTPVQCWTICYSISIAQQIYWDAMAKDRCLDGWESLKGRDFFLHFETNFNGGNNNSANVMVLPTYSILELIAIIHTSSGTFCWSSLQLSSHSFGPQNSSVPWSSQQSS